jgi:tellurite resistance protein
MAPVHFAPAEAQEIVRALAAIAAADGAILARETNLLEGFAMQHGIGSHIWLAAKLDEPALARTVTEPDKRREVLRLCLEMAHADGEYADTERELIVRIARAFRVGDDELAALTAAARG